MIGHLSKHLWCVASLRGMKVTAQLIRQKMKPSKIFLSIWLTFYCSIYQILRALFQRSLFSTHTVSNSHLRSISYSLNQFLSLSLAYSPLHFYLSPLYTKRKWFELPASLIKLISTNIVPHLGVAHNTLSIFRSCC